MNDTWSQEDCDPTADIQAMLKKIESETGYIPSRCFCCGGILPGHIDECRIAIALKKAFKELLEDNNEL